MQPLDLVSLFTAPLERCGVPYFVTGSVAALLYGEPRMTHDVDLVLTLSDREIPRVLEAFPESDFYVPPLDVVLIEVRRPNMSSCESSHGFAKAGRRNTSARRGILALLGADAASLDHVALQRWIDTLGLAAQWRLVSPESEP